MPELMAVPEIRIKDYANQWTILLDKKQALILYSKPYKSMKRAVGFGRDCGG